MALASLAQAGQMILFARVVDAGSFAAAAKALGQTRAAVSKQIGSLEARIGAPLLNRTTRRMHLTEVGREFYAHCSRIAREAEEAERVVASLQGAARGVLRIAAPVTFGGRYLAPELGRFLADYPELQVDLRLSDGTPDLIAEDFDVGIRIAAKVDSALVARRLAQSRHVVCASPAYFQAHGVPESPDDLRDHNCLLYTQLDTPALWRFRRRSVRVAGNFSVDHGESLRQALLDGLGIAHVPTFVVGEDIAAGRLHTALDPHVALRQNVYAMYPRNRTLTPKVRAFVDFLAKHLSPPPWEPLPEKTARA